MAEVDITHNDDGTVTIPVKIYNDLKERAELGDKVRSDNAERGRKRWAGKTAEERSAAMKRVAAARKKASS